MSDMPPPVTRRSSRAELWDELCAARDEIDAQQLGIGELTDQLTAARAEAKALREKAARAYFRLNVIQAALAHPEAS